MFSSPNTYRQFVVNLQKYPSKWDLCFFSIFLCFIYYAQHICAQTEPISNIIIHFNATGLDYRNDVLFWLYTRDNENNSQRLFVNDESVLRQSSYDTARPTKFVTHGWTSSGSDPACLLPKLGFLHHDDYNVIVVDWNSTAKSEYFYAASRVKAVGWYVSKMIKFLADQGNDVKQMSLVGHSLGAHVMGLASYKLSNKVGHIVGLDPAKPGFEINGPGGRLYHTDADHVEIIHTNAGKLGFSFNIGDVDYWVNGGSLQPGCTQDLTGSCSHGRSYMYYAESLENPDSWYAVMCGTYGAFKSGFCDNNQIEPFPRWEPVPEKPKGTYMLRTNATPLYGLGLEGAKSA